MTKVSTLYHSILSDLEIVGRDSPYSADANEPDSRYKSYGVRAAGKKEIIKTHHQSIQGLQLNEKLDLARQLIESEYGEQQSIALYILEPIAGYFTPGRFDELDRYIRYLHGWSKIDAYTGSLLRDVLFRYPDNLVDLVSQWNHDDDLWLRRASVVLFTRKVAASGLFTDTALNFCENLIYDPEVMVQKGVGWSIKDLMRVEKDRIIDYVIDLRARGVSSVITLYAIKDLKGDERAKILSKK